MILRPLFHIINQTSLVAQIALGLLAGILLAWLWPEATASVGFLGSLFISALKAVAPVLVFILVASAIANHSPGQPTHIRPILLLYLMSHQVKLLFIWLPLRSRGPLSRFSVYV